MSNEATANVNAPTNSENHPTTPIATKIANIHAKMQYIESLTDQTMIEKVRLTVKLHNSNYFINTPETEFNSIEATIRTNKLIPTNFKSMFRDFVSKNKKLAWVMDHIDDEFCSAFKKEYPSSKTLSAVHKIAGEIYSEHCENYMKYRVRKGENAIKRQRPVSPASNINIDDQASKSLQNAIIRESFDNNAKDMMQEVERMVTITQSGINQVFSGELISDLEFAKNIWGISDLKGVQLSKLKAVVLMAYIRKTVHDLTTTDLN